MSISKIKEIKIREEDGSYSDPIPMGADAINIDYKDTNVNDELNKLNNDNNTNKQNITTLQNKVNANSNNIKIQTQRIDNLSTLPEGSTTGDAELIDIRVGADETTYDTAGKAVRTQIENLYTSINGNTIDNKLENYLAQAKIINDGYIYANVNYRYRWSTDTNKSVRTIQLDGTKDYILCCDAKDIIYNTQIGMVAWYDENYTLFQGGILLFNAKYERLGRDTNTIYMIPCMFNKYDYNIDHRCYYFYLPANPSSKYLCINYRFLNNNLVDLNIPIKIYQMSIDDFAQDKIQKLLSINSNITLNTFNNEQNPNLEINHFSFPGCYDTAANIHIFPPYDINGLDRGANAACIPVKPSTKYHIYLKPGKQHYQSINDTNPNSYYISTMYKNWSHCKNHKYIDATDKEKVLINNEFYLHYTITTNENEYWLGYNKDYLYKNADSGAEYHYNLELLLLEREITNNKYTISQLDNYPIESSIQLDELEYIMNTYYKNKNIRFYGDSRTWYDGQNYTASCKTEWAGKRCIGYQQTVKKLTGCNIQSYGYNGNKSNQICNYIKQHDFSDVDVVVLDGGVNDQVAGLTLGELQPINSTFDTTTTYGAWQSAIEYIISNNPKTKIIVNTPYSAWIGGNKNNDSIAKAKKEIAELYNLPCCDLYHNDRLNENNKSYFYCDDPTKTNTWYLHLNDYGNELIGEILARFILSH